MSLMKEFTDFLIENELPITDKAAALIGKLGVADEELLWLAALNSAGVDNWDGCDYASDLYRQLAGDEDDSD